MEGLDACARTMAHSWRPGHSDATLSGRTCRRGKLARDAHYLETSKCHVRSMERSGISAPLRLGIAIEHPLDSKPICHLSEISAPRLHGEGCSDLTALCETSKEKPCLFVVIQLEHHCGTSHR